MKLLFILILIPFSVKADIYSKEKWVEFYLRDCKTVTAKQTCKRKLETALGLMIANQEMTFKYLDVQSLPRWLAIVPVVESSYNAKAKSRAGALGLFQLMDYNIKYYKTIKVNILGRRIKIPPTQDQIVQYGYNPVASTEMGTKHLKILYKKFGHYEDYEKLALYAYNAGPTRVRKWLAGKVNLPHETINYYHKLMAVQYIIRNKKRLNVRPVKQKKMFVVGYLYAMAQLKEEQEGNRISTLVSRN